MGQQFKEYVASAIVRKSGVTRAEAIALVEGSALSALLVGNSSYLFYRGAEYWADIILAK